MNTAQIGDPTMPWLEAAVDVETAGPHIVAALAERQAVPLGARLTQATLRRHKRGRRAMIAYTVTDGASGWRCQALGKTRARGLDTRTANVVDTIGAAWNRPRRPNAAAVPPMLGIVPEYHLWLQGEIPGRPGWVALSAPDGPAAATRIGSALAQLHDLASLCDRRHETGDEFAIIEAKLIGLARARPDLEVRIGALLAATSELVARVERSPTVGLHRDFYPDQVMVGDLVYLLDLDLYARGDPAIDLGNFIAHLTEYDLRTERYARPLSSLREPFLDGYRSIRPAPADRAIRVFEAVTLVRHIALSASFPERIHTTDALLRMAEAATKELSR